MLAAGSLTLRQNLDSHSLYYLLFDIKWETPFQLHIFPHSSNRPSQSDDDSDARTGLVPVGEKVPKKIIASALRLMRPMKDFTHVSEAPGLPLSEVPSTCSQIRNRTFHDVLADHERGYLPVGGQH